MADLETLANDLYNPLLRYHESKGTTVAGVNAPKASARLDAVKLGSDLLGKSNIMKLMDSLSGQNGDTVKLSDAIISKWKDEKNGGSKFIDALNNDLGRDPAATARLIDAIKKDPNKIAANLNGMTQYTPGSLATLIPAVATPAPAVVATNAPIATQPKPAAVRAAPVSIVASGPATSGTTAPVGAPATAGGGTIVNQPAPPVDTQGIMRGVFESLADASDEKIVQSLNKGMVKSILTSMSQDAITKFGVSASDANGFKETIIDPDNDRLLDRITKNFQSNPEFIRQLARASKDSGEPISEMKKNAARSLMTPIMENPQKLAEDDYVKELTRNLKMGNSKSPFMDFFKNMFGEGMGGWIGQFIEKIKSFFSGFSGNSKVFSVVSQPGSLLPSVLINQDAIAENRNRHYAQSTVGANDLTTFPEPYKTVAVKGPDGKPKLDNDGKPMTEKVANTFKMQINGKDTEVVLARGLMANEVKGHIDPTTNQFVPSNKVAFWGTKTDGGQPELLETTKAEFIKYKAAVDAASAKYGDGKQLAFTDYTEQDARASLRNQPQIQMASVDPQTGAVTQKQVVAGLPVTQGQVRPKNTTASGQDRDYELQG